ncbi:MAG: hypothetical protein ACE5WD_04350 [Candidatus Aminicenantia bacterium]
MSKLKSFFIFSVIFSLWILFPACNKLENETQSNSLLIIKSLKGYNWEEEEADVLFSDVIVETETSIYVQPDLGVGELTAKLLNPSPDIQSSIYNDIMLERYVVHFVRSDGKNTPGEDVPYPIEGSLSVLVEIGGTTTVSFVVVTINAKIEPPLVNLVEGGEPGIKTTAVIDFYGRDLANHKVKATGYLPVFFNNYSNEIGG